MALKTIGSSYFSFKNCSNPHGCFSIAIGILQRAATSVFGWIAKQQSRLAKNLFRRSTNKPKGPGVDPLGPFGSITHDENGFAERRSFLLHTSGIGEQESGSIHQP